MRETFFLWHLEHLGVIARAGNAFRADLWGDAASVDPVTVALIDTGLDTGHPNLAEAMAGAQIDFGPSLNGVVYEPAGGAVASLRNALSEPAPKIDDVDTALAAVMDDARAHARHIGLDLDALQTAVSDAQNAGDADARIAAAPGVLRALRVAQTRPDPEAVDLDADATQAIADLGLSPDDRAAVTARARMMAAGPEVLPVADISRYFGAHGTASAGLICGRPGGGGAFGALPYYGVNPHARLLSFATPFSHEIRPVLNAVIAAYLSGAEVIVMPRGVPDVAARADLPASALRATRIEVADDTKVVDEDLANLKRLKADATLLEKVLAAVARRRYLVLAAGNEGWPDRVGYPASALAAGPHAVIVGAESGDGSPVSYSNGNDMGARLIRLVSDDAEELDADGVRVDPDRIRGWDFDLSPHAPDGVTEIYPFAPLTTDVRGSYGYAASGTSDEADYDDGEERPALYTLFGGTSAACALAGGLISLLVQTGALPRTGAPASAVAQALDDAGLGRPGAGT